MKPSLFAAGIALALAAQLVALQPVRAGAAAVLADSRCNDQMINDAARRVDDYDRHAPGKGTAQLVQRYAALAELLATINEEQQILDSVCSSDAQRAPLFTQIAATTAWTLTLESDVAARLNTSCPVAATGLPTMMLADAWLALANVVNNNNGTVPAAFSTITPKVESRAQAVGLPLPAWAETSAYWRDQVHQKEKIAIAAACPSPSPAPSPT